MRTRRLEVHLLGRFEVRADGAAALVAPSQQRLVAFLGIHHWPLARSYVAGMLWPDGTDRRAAANLRSALWRLGALGSALVEATPTTLGLQPSVDVDARVLARTARELLSRDGARADLPGGDLLPGWNDPWVVAERERLREIRAHAVEAHGRRLLGAGQAAAALAVAGAAVDVDPTRESAHHLLGVALGVAGSAACIPEPPPQGSPRSVPCRRR